MLALNWHTNTSCRLRGRWDVGCGVFDLRETWRSDGMESLARKESDFPYPFVTSGWNFLHHERFSD